MIKDKFFEKVEIILTSKGLSTSKRDFSNCRLTLNENYLIVSTYEETDNIDGQIYQIFNLSEITKFKTIEHNKTKIKTTKK